MPLQYNRLIIQLSYEASDQKFLEGIDVWLRLKLISDAEVKRLCRENLSCTIPNLISERTIKATLTQSSRLSHEAEESLLPATIGREPQQSLLPATINKTAQMLQYLMAEFSLMWLLFLGVFMVVVSSGVLAVSQWRQFPHLGQYLILLSYTLAFWVASTWTGRRENLRLTAYMLKITTLLIIPVNFWMIDQLKLWTSGLGLAIAAIAASLLTAIIIRLFKVSIPSINARESLLTLVNSVCLSWLHWGWGWDGFPIVATYIGTVGTATLFYLDRNKPFASQTLRRQLSLGTITVAAATLLLLVRAIFMEKVPVSQLGAAIGICGWLFCWLSLQNPNIERRGMSNQPVVIAGSILLLVGWYVSVTAETPWQAIAVSGLGLWLLIARLRLWWQIRDLTAIFLLGLQSVCLLWRVIPAELQKTIIDVTNRITETTPWVMVGVALFPYVLLTLFLAARMRRWQKPALANHAEFLALVLGVALTSLSLANPLVRSLNLLLSSLTLAVLCQKRITPKAALIYATHITALTAIASGIDLLLPNIGIRAWTMILLGGMVAEWSFSIGSNWRMWRRSAWHIGLGLAAISYSFLLSTTLTLSDSSVWNWGLIGWAIPVTLTVIASYPQFVGSCFNGGNSRNALFPQRQLATLLSILGSFLIQILTFGAAAPQLISLGIATILMLLNTRQLQFLLPAVLTVGFALTFSSAAIDTVFSKLSFDLWLNILAIAPLALWLLRQQLSVRHSTLSRIYTQATDGWASTIASWNLLILSAYVLFLYITPNKADWEIILAATLIAIAIIYRTLPSSKFGFYGIAWGLEILVASIATLTDQPLVNLAIANLALGLTCQLIGDWWIRRSNQNYRFSWHIIPLLYAVLGFLFQHSSFTASTGLFTLGAALIGIGVSRRHNSFKVLTYLSLLGVSIAAYELLYQLQQAQGGSYANGLVILAGLGTAIAISDRWLTRWLVLYLRLKSGELHVIAHLHWALSSGLIGLALSDSPNFGGVVTIAVLGIYALLQGRLRETEANSFGEAWIYAGIIEAVGAISFLLKLMYPASEWLIAWSAAIACVFASGMYTLPWNSWGWSIGPWRRLAYILPGFFIVLSIGQIALQCLLIVAAFYAWIAIGSRNVRLSYISIVLADWALVRLFEIYQLSEPLWYASLLGGSLLYVAQIEPGLQAATEKEKRHLLRCLATGLICLTALYQSEANLLLGLLTVGFGIGFIVVGLALRIRAFLYVGTVTFIVQVLRQLWFFINDYSLLLWSMGMVLGIALIWIAANFESHRAQTISLLRGWVSELEDWE